MRARNGAERAAQLHEHYLRQLWGPPDPPKREPGPAGGTARPGNFEAGTAAANSPSSDVTQRAIRHAARRVGHLEHHARVLGLIGQRDAAGRLWLLAEQIKVQVLA
jgi:hypothetical protein